MDYNPDGGTQRTLKEFGKLAKKREDLYIQTYNILTALPLLTEGQTYKDKIGERLARHVVVKENVLGIGSIAYQTPAFLMQDLANLAGKESEDEKKEEKTYPMLDQNVAKKYERAKFSFVLTSGPISSVPPLVDALLTPPFVDITRLGGMAHPHLPQTYYLIARNHAIPLK